MGSGLIGRISTDPANPTRRLSLLLHYTLMWCTVESTVWADRCVGALFPSPTTTRSSLAHSLSPSAQLNSDYSTYIVAGVCYCWMAPDNITSTGAFQQQNLSFFFPFYGWPNDDVTFVGGCRLLDSFHFFVSRVATGEMNFLISLFDLKKRILSNLWILAPFFGKILSVFNLLLFIRNMATSLRFILGGNRNPLLGL